MINSFWTDPPCLICGHRYCRCPQRSFPEVPLTVGEWLGIGITILVVVVLAVLGA